MIRFDASSSCRKWIVLFLLLSGHTGGWGQSIRDVHEKYHPLIKDAREDTTLVRNLLRYSDELMDLNNDTALVVLERVAVLSEKLNDIYGKGKTASFMGIVYADKADFPRSRSYYEKAVGHFKALGNYLELGKVYNNTANLYYWQDQDDEAISWYLKAVEAFEKSGHQQLLAQVNDGIGNVFHELGQYEKSLHYLRKAESLARANRDTPAVTRILNNISVTYTSMDKQKEALDLELEVLRLADLRKDEKTRLMIRSNIANSYINLNQLDSAQYYLQQAEAIVRRTDFPYYHLQVLGCYAKLYQGKKQYALARDYLLKSIALGEKIGSKEALFKGYGNLLKVYSAMGLYEKSMEAFGKFVLYNDSIANENMANRVNDLETKYRTLQKDKEISDKQLAIEQHKTALKRKDMAIVISVIALLTLAIVGSLVWLGARQKQKLRWLMLQKEHELLAVKAMMEGEEKERSRIARNLHDGVASILSAARLNMDSLGHQVGQLPAIPAYRESLSLLKDATSEIRETAHNLMPVILRERGLEEAVRAFCKKVSNNHTLAIDFQSVGNPARFNHHFELMVYRTIQELINNVIKHADATRVLVQLSFLPDRFSVTVEDNGKGFDPAGTTYSDGMGISSLQSRMEAFQGKMDIDSSAGGTVVYIAFDAGILSIA